MNQCQIYAWISSPLRHSNPQGPLEDGSRGHLEFKQRRPNLNQVSFKLSIKSQKTKYPKKNLDGLQYVFVPYSSMTKTVSYPSKIKEPENETQRYVIWTWLNLRQNPTGKPTSTSTRTEREKHQ